LVAVEDGRLRLDPVQPFCRFAIGDAPHAIAKRPRDLAKHLLRVRKRDAADDQDVAPVRQACSHRLAPPQTLLIFRDLTAMGMFMSNNGICTIHKQHL